MFKIKVKLIYLATAGELVSSAFSAMDLKMERTNIYQLE